MLILFFLVATFVSLIIVGVDWVQNAGLGGDNEFRMSLGLGMMKMSTLIPAMQSE